MDKELSFSARVALDAVCQHLRDLVDEVSARPVRRLHVYAEDVGVEVEWPVPQPEPGGVGMTGEAGPTGPPGQGDTPHSSGVDPFGTNGHRRARGGLNGNGCANGGNGGAWNGANGTVRLSGALVSAGCPGETPGVSETEIDAGVRGSGVTDPAVRKINPAAAGVSSILSKSEIRVASLAALGLKNDQIASKLFITVSTVEQHLTHVYKKLKISGRADLPYEINGRH